MEDLVRILQTYGLQIVFVGVLLDQGGLPLPSFSLVIVAAGVATEAGQPVWPIFALGKKRAAARACDARHPRLRDRAA